MFESQWRLERATPTNTLTLFPGCIQTVHQENVSRFFQYLILFIARTLICQVLARHLLSRITGGKKLCGYPGWSLKLLTRSIAL